MNFPQNAPFDRVREQRSMYKRYKNCIHFVNYIDMFSRFKIFMSQYCVFQIQSSSGLIFSTILVSRGTSQRRQISQKIQESEIKCFSILFDMGNDFPFDFLIFSVLINVQCANTHLHLNDLFTQLCFMNLDTKGVF